MTGHDQSEEAAFRAWQIEQASSIRREAELTAAFQHFYDGKAALPISILEEIQDERELCRRLSAEFKSARGVADCSA